MTFDLSDLEYISSAGLRLILMLRKKYQKLKIINANENVYNVFYITGLTDFLLIDEPAKVSAVPNVEMGSLNDTAWDFEYKSAVDMFTEHVYKDPEKMADQKRAGQVFSMIVELAIIAGIAMTVIGNILLTPFMRWQRAQGELLTEAEIYARIMIISFMFTALAYVFQLLLITADQQKMAVLITLAAGVTNIGLDALFILVFHWGIKGAAIASVIGQAISGLVPLFYFASGRNRILKLRPAKLELPVCTQTCSNGVSEMIENLAESFVGMLYNMQLIKIAGEAGVSAYGAILNIWNILTLLFIGFNEAIVPVIAYHYGAGNEKELKNLFKNCLIIVGATSLILFAFVEIGAFGLAAIFIHKNDELLKVTVYGFRICGISMLFLGCNYFATSFFTALNDGLVSGLLSAFIMLVFPVLTVMTMPGLFGMDGVWFSRSVTAMMGFGCSVFAFIWGKKKYHYMN